MPRDSGPRLLGLIDLLPPAAPSSTPPTLTCFCLSLSVLQPTAPCLEAEEVRTQTF